MVLCTTRFGTGSVFVNGSMNDYRQLLVHSRTTFLSSLVCIHSSEFILQTNMSLNFELSLFDAPTAMGYLNDAMEHLIKSKDSVMEYMSEFNKKVGPVVVYMTNETSSYVKEEYKFVAITCLLVVLVYMSCSGSRNGYHKRSSGDKWYHNMSPDEEKRVKRVNSGGYAIMSCNSCDNTAVYGSSRGCAPVACFEHKGSGMVKVFGCSIDSCRKKCVRGGLYCKSHMK